MHTKEQKFYDFSIKSSQWQQINFEQFKDKVVMVVNTATKCGLANQFTILEDLHQKYQKDGLIIIGFPCNQFLSQEPETNETMAATCKINFGVTFPLTEKINVNGPDAHPIFVYLKKHLGWGIFWSRIKRNFTKFLISKEGKPFKRYSPTTNPEKIEKDIQTLLKK